MPVTSPIAIAGRIIRDGGVVAYPTEGVYGLGCMPESAYAVARILDIKKRDASKGLIIIASKSTQLADWIALTGDTTIPEPVLGQPVTWIVPATAHVPGWIRGDHEGVAVRITNHAVAGGLCEAADSPIVSTSANITGRPVARNGFVLRRNFGHLVDYIVPGECGPAATHSEVRDLLSGQTLRSGD